MVDIIKAMPRNSPYLSAHELIGLGDVELTIRGYEEQPRPKHWGRASDGSRTIHVVHFEGSGKSLWLNATNMRTIVEMLGRETDDWAGNAIRVYRGEVERGSQKGTPCVRVRKGPRKQSNKQLADV